MNKEKGYYFKLGPNYTYLVLSLVLIGIFVYYYHDEPMVLIWWIGSISFINIVYFLTKPVLYLYDNYFYLTKLFKQRKKILYSDIKSIRYFSSSFGGREDNLTIYFFVNGVESNSKFVFISSPPIKMLKFFYSKNIHLDIDIENLEKMVKEKIADD